MARSMVKEMATVLSEAVSKIQAIASGLTVPADHERTYHEHPKPETSVQTSQLTTEPTFITNLHNQPRTYPIQAEEPLPWPEA